MNNNEQVFYVQYRKNDGYLTTLKDQKGYEDLSDNDKQKYTQVIVDLSHLAGWGNYWTKCRYVNGALSYPDNYPEDQSNTIDDLKGQLAKIIASNNDKEKSNEDLQAKLSQANEKINAANRQIQKLSTLSTQLQLQIANANQAAKDAQNAKAKSDDVANSMASSAAAANKGGNE